MQEIYNVLLWLDNGILTHVILGYLAGTDV